MPSMRTPGPARVRCPAGCRWRDGLVVLCRLVDQSRSVTISGSDHMLIWDRPDTVVEAILDLIAVEQDPST